MVDNDQTPDGDAARALRQALRNHARGLQPSDRFTAVVDQVRSSELGGVHRPRFRTIVVGTCVALLVGLMLPLVVPRLLGRTQGEASQLSPALSTSSTLTTGPPSLPTLQRQLAIYYVGPDQRLYREFRDLPTQSDRLTTALAAVLNVVPQDAAYSSYWAGGQVNSVHVVGARIIVDISTSAFANFTTREVAEAAINQIVYTATAAVGDNTGAKTVQILQNGSRHLPVIGAPTTDFVREGTRPLGLVWLASPSAAIPSAAGQVAIEGTQQLSAMSAIVHWQVRTSSGAVVAEGQAQASGSGGGWRTWRATARLVAGDYVVRYWTSGSPQIDRQFRVV